jgi:hypothetical protein
MISRTFLGMRNVTDESCRGNQNKFCVHPPHPENRAVYDTIYNVFIFNCNWVATRWQLFSTHVHTNNTENVTKQTIHRTTQKIHRTAQQLGRVRAVPYSLTADGKARKNLSQGTHT